MNDLSKYIPIMETNENTSSIHYLDFDNVESDEIELKLFVKNFQLKEKNDNIKQEIINKIVELSELNIDMIEKFSMKNELITPEMTVHRMFYSKLVNASNYIATNGRIGPANTILISEKNYDLYKDTINSNDMLKKMDVVFGEVDDVFLYRKNDQSNPGLILIVNTKDNLYEIVDIGFFPHKQFMKVTLLK